MALQAWAEQAFRPASALLAELKVVEGLSEYQQGCTRLTDHPYRELARLWYSQAEPGTQGWRVVAGHSEQLPPVVQMGERDSALPTAAAQGDLRPLLEVRWVQCAKKVQVQASAPWWRPSQSHLISLHRAVPPF